MSFKAVSHIVFVVEGRSQHIVVFSYHARKLPVKFP